ncbi:hypothetical protein J7W19_31915 [Streptomyces mobaraensis NBRC 13819 = DSM 40847]|uniref:Uncharacterized protein n=2 Tax=Streptomyces mobaraensis TaxID=35621 RepID=A0A5N5W478_STRMB|nr:DUF6332 family protein [Streptomyces mobaraensis]EMF00360.1 hypothetical protein H340_11645 [Streptomyces mobaraensis NBRC 13819 = DSM 40847]KAB7839603.1 hypothetical protein FRZ00_22015 [Streptomyces mobaraensis]QTT77377.1 hypothetical protein J7W19_31915 [Streptomyces mobaraensis NBRC 13819 = DSM 40847]
MGSGTRSQAERDAVTVEIGYALLSACFVGFVVFAAVAGPTLVWDLPTAVGKALVIAGTVLGSVLGVVRVVRVLWRFAGAPAGPGDG